LPVGNNQSGDAQTLSQIGTVCESEKFFCEAAPDDDELVLPQILKITCKMQESVCMSVSAKMQECRTENMHVKKRYRVLGKRRRIQSVWFLTPGTRTIKKGAFNITKSE